MIPELGLWASLSLGSRVARGPAVTLTVSGPEGKTPMLGKVLEATVRLNVYVTKPGGHTKAISADGWGFSQMTGRQCLVVRDIHSLVTKVLGMVVRKTGLPAEEMALLDRVRVVEESVTSSGRSEWKFYVEEVDEKTAAAVLHSPIIEPGSVVGGGIRL
jgi:hypothetical protein